VTQTCAHIRRGLFQTQFSCSLKAEEAAAEVVENLTELEEGDEEIEEGLEDELEEQEEETYVIARMNELMARKEVGEEAELQKALKMPDGLENLLHAEAKAAKENSQVGNAGKK
jgi:hypothetical protein